MDAVAGEDLRLPVQRKMIGVFRHNDIGNERFRRDAAFDKPRRSWSLHHRLLAFAAVFAATGDYDAQGCRDFVEALGFVLADYMHLLTTTGADRAFRFDDLFDARQVSRQRSPVGAAFLRPLALEALVFLFFLSFGFGAGGLQLLQHKIELVLAQPLGTAAEPGSPQHRDHMMELVIGSAEPVAFQDQELLLGPLSQNRRT